MDVQADPARHEDDTTGRRGARAGSPTALPAAGWTDVLRRTGERVSADGLPMMAAAVAFAAFLSIFPALIAAILVYGIVTDPGVAADQASRLTETLPSQAGSLISEQMQQVASSRGSGIGFGLVASIAAALWGASGGMAMLLKGVTKSYEEEEDRGFVKNRALGMVFALGAILFLGVTVAAIAVVPVLLQDLGTTGLILGNIARWVVLALVIAVALGVVYRFAPQREPATVRWLTPGAAVSTVLWLVGTAAFSWFVASFGSFGETYGALAGVVVLMLWLQLSAFVVLFGAALNAEVEHQTGVDTTTGSDDPRGERGAHAADERPAPAAQHDEIDLSDSDGQLATPRSSR